MDNMITLEILEELKAPDNIKWDFYSSGVEKISVDEYCLNKGTNHYCIWYIENFDLQTETYKSLLKSTSYMIRQAIAKNTKDKEVFILLAKDELSVARKTVAKRNTHKEVFNILVNDKNKDVLYALVHNDSLSDEELIKISTNEDKDTKLMAQKQLESRGYKIKWEKQDDK